MSQDPYLQLCDDAVNGKLEEVENALSQHPELPFRSLHVAAVIGDEENVKKHLEADPGSVDDPILQHYTPLILLSMSHFGRTGHRRMGAVLRSASMLLDYKAQLNIFVPSADRSGFRVSPLSAAVGITGNMGITQLFLAQGANPNDGASVLLAAAHERADTLDRLLMSGADVNAPDPDYGWPPLHNLLDWHFTPNAVQLLLDRGANPNSRGGVFEETALHTAVRRRRVEMIEVLHRAGADLNLPTKGGMTAYRHALRRGFDACVLKLEKLGADTAITAYDQLAVALINRDMDYAREIMKAIPDLLMYGSPEESRLLPDLAAMGNNDAVSFLLDHGLDITARGLDNGTALHQAAWFGQQDTAKILLKHGAPHNILGDHHHSTPLGWAAHGARFSGDALSRQNDYLTIVRDLLAAGAQFPNAEDSHDHWQLDNSTEEVKSVLREHGWEG